MIVHNSDLTVKIYSEKILTLSSSFSENWHLTIFRQNA
jgi:hypothetical protein